MTRPAVVIAEPLADEPLRWLEDHADVRHAPGDRDRLRELLPGARALVVRTYTIVDESLLDAAPDLEVVGRAGVGLDNIDLDACEKRGIDVVNTPEANAEAVAEYVLAAAMHALRPLATIDHALDRDEWERLRKEAIVPREVRECVVGVWGLGAIGRRVARIFRGLAKAVLYHDVVDIPESERFGAEPVSVEDLLERSDVLTLHVDARPENRHLIDARALDSMRPDAVLINAARGVIIDERALAAHLRSRERFSAVLDVFDPEPVEPDNPLLGLPNATLTPHIGGATRKAKLAMSWVVRDVLDALERRSG